MVNESFVTRENFEIKISPRQKTAKDLLNTVQRFQHTILSGFASKLLIAKYLIAESDSFLNSRS